MSLYWKLILRSIKDSLPRFLAIFAIICLGVGFFSGLKATTPSFYRTAEEYITDQNMYDFRLISTIGFDEDDISRLPPVPMSAPVLSSAMRWYTRAEKLML